MSRNTRATLAMLFVGLAIFSGLYTTQAILPTLVGELGFTPAQAALTVSAATGALALCVIPASILSERFGRGRLLIISALSASVVGLLVPLMGTNPLALIVLRGVQGALLAGAPAVAMAWLSEELGGDVLPRAMGLYIAGTSIGGLTGRIVPATFLDITGWRPALAISALVSLSFAFLSWVLLPAQRNFTPKTLRFASEFRAMAKHLHSPLLRALYLVPFLAMGSFVSLFNFLSFRLIGHFGLPAALAGSVFLIYLSGTWSSARAGRFVQRFGYGRTLVTAAAMMFVGTVCTLGPLWLLVLGVLSFTMGFFAAHSTTSSWIGQAATHDRAEASSIYVFCYYVGSSVVGALSGVVFDHAAWSGFVAFIAFFTALLLGLAIRTSRFSRA
ncbi:MAG: MFS transporter [Corynebacterium sp.]|nr:MFS transporter [Corynebacterium sp.]